MSLSGRVTDSSEAAVTVIMMTMMDEGPGAGPGGLAPDN